MDPDSSYHVLLHSILSAQISHNAQLGLAFVILVLLLLTALIAGSEVAFFSLSARDITFIKQQEENGYKTILHLLEHPKKLLATLLIGNNFLSIGVIISTNLLFHSLIRPDQFLHGFPTALVSFIDIFIQVVIVTFFLVLFGEVLPKVYATQHNLRLSYFTAPLILFLDRLFSPVSRFLVSSTYFIEGKLQQHTRNEISNEDMENAIDLTLGHSASREEVNIFKGIIKFKDITVKQIMRNRHDVEGIDLHWNFEQVKKQVIESGFSRLPVYEESLDNVKGIIHSKDLLQHINEEDFDWHVLMRPVKFVHETKLIKPLLKEFQSKRNHMAVVVDEFGGTSGLVTLEDIMEEIIGEIKDEFDEDELPVRVLDEHNYIFEGKTLINDFCRRLNVPYETFESVRGESDSLAGLVLELSGKFPSPDDVLHYDQFDFTVLEVEKMRLQKIKVTLHPEEAAESN